MGLGQNKPHDGVEESPCQTHNKLGKDVSVLPRAGFLVTHAGRKYKSSTSEIKALSRIDSQDSCAPMPQGSCCLRRAKSSWHADNSKANLVEEPVRQ